MNTHDIALYGFHNYSKLFTYNLIWATLCVCCMHVMWSYYNNIQFIGMNAKLSSLLLVSGYSAMGMISTVQLTADACVRVVDCLCVLSRIHVIDDNSIGYR